MGPVNIEDLKKHMAASKQKNSGYFSNQLKSKPPLYIPQPKNKLLSMS